jgi:hypothetical protein
MLWDVMRTDMTSSKSVLRRGVNARSGEAASAFAWPAVPPGPKAAADSFVRTRAFPAQWTGPG